MKSGRLPFDLPFCLPGLDLPLPLFPLLVPLAAPLGDQDWNSQDLPEVGLMRSGWRLLKEAESSIWVLMTRPMTNRAKIRLLRMRPLTGSVVDLGATKAFGAALNGLVWGALCCPSKSFSKR